MNPIDKKIREKFQNHQSAVDTDALWKDVYPSIKKKRKRYLGFWLIAAFSISATSFLWYSNTLNEKEEVNVAIHEEKNLTNNLVEHPMAQSIDKNERGQKDLQDHKLLSSSQIIKTSKNSNQEKTLEKNSTDKAQKAEAIYKDIYRQEIAEASKVQSQELPSTNKRTPKDKSIQKEAIPNSLIKEVITTESLIASKEDPIIGKQVRQNFKSVKLHQEYKSLIFEDTILNSIPIASFKADKEDWFVSPSFGLFLTSRKLLTNEANSNEATALKIVERDEKESQLESSIIEFALGRVIKNNWGISLGINYRETNELSENTIQRLDTIVKDDILIEIRNMPNGMQEEIFGSAQVPQTIITQEGRYSKYRSVSAFADVFYRFQTNKIIWQAELGLQQSAWLKADGYIIDSVTGFYDLQEDRENILANTGGLSIRTGLGVLVPITDSWSLQAKTRFIKDFNSLLSQENEIIQKYQLLGISGGVQLAF